MRRRAQRWVFVALVLIVGGAVLIRGWYKGHLGAPVSEFGAVEQTLARSIRDKHRVVTSPPSLSGPEASKHRSPEKLSISLKGGVGTINMGTQEPVRIPLVRTD